MLSGESIRQAEKGVNMITIPSGEQEPDRLAPETREAIRWARKHAASMQAQEVSPEHLLQGLVEQGDGSILRALGKAGIDAGAIRLRIEQLFGAYSDSDLRGDELPLSKEAQKCLDWAHSFAWSEAVGERQAVPVSPVLLMIALLRTKQTQIFLLPILPTLKNIFASLLRDTWRTKLSDLDALTYDTIETLPRMPDPSFLYSGTAPDVWSTIGQRYAPGQIVSGVVTRAFRFGLFVRIEEGIEGLVQPAEIPFGGNERLRGFNAESYQAASRERDLSVRNIPSLFSTGQRLRLRIVRIDAERHRLGLSLRNIPLETASEALCPSCQQAVPTNWKHCAYCGVELAKVCQKCGTPCPDIEGACFCFECGQRLD
jgi:predicted RNA-binding protein with RPS1 domain